MPPFDSYIRSFQFHFFVFKIFALVSLSRVQHFAAAEM
jgi:hypothetical protein